MKVLKPFFLFAIPILLSACTAFQLPDTDTKSVARVDYLANIAPIETACRSVRTAVGTLTAASANVQQIDRIEIVADPESAASLVARGHALSLITDDIEGTNTLFRLALSRTDTNTPASRVHWSHGWAMFNQKQYSCALAHFAAAYKANPDDARWAHYTYAVTYWRLNDSANAIRFYEEAVSKEPSCWRDVPSGIRCTGRWRNHQRRAWSELFAAWKAHRIARDSATTETHISN
jgi:tetratricopeptide (TPR) repeat protein